MIDGITSNINTNIIGENMAADSKTKMHHQILKLTKEGNHKEALRIAKIFCEKYPDDVE